MKKNIKKMYKQIFETIRYYGWFSLLFVFFLTFITFLFFNSVKAQKQYIILEESSLATQDINIFSYHISQLLSTAHNDMHIITAADEANDYLLDQSQNNLDEFESLLLRIGSNKHEFLSLALLDTSGQEMLRVSRRDGSLRRLQELGNVDLEPYMGVGDANHEQLGYIKGIEMIDGVPVIHMLQALYIDDDVHAYMLLCYNASHFLSIFDVYANETSSNFSIGLINENNIWEIDSNTYNFSLITDEYRQEQIFDNISNDDNTLSSNVILERRIYDHTGLDEDFFTIYATVDAEAAIQASNQFIVNNTWIIYVIDVIGLILVVFVGNLIRNKNQDKILLNANMYLSAKNKDGVLISDHHFKTVYINQALTEYLDYSMDELFGLNPNDIFKPVFSDGPFDYRQIDDIYQGHVWNLTKEGVFLLSYVRIKKEGTTKGKNRRFISIYSNPTLNFSDIDITNLNDYVNVISPMIEQFEINQAHSVLILLKVSNIDGYDFSLFINQYAKYNFKVVLAHKRHIFIFNNAVDHSIDDCMVEMDRLINLYRNQPDVGLNFKHFYSIVRMNETSDTVRKAVETTFIGLKANRDSNQAIHQIFESGMVEEVTRSNLIRDTLTYGFENNEFYLNYQLLKDTKEDRMIGVEALLRWDNIDLGQISPGEFVPVIENSHYINQLTIMVIKNVIKDFTPYKDILPDYFKISVNVTYFDFVNDYILDEVVDLIDKSQLKNSTFLFEIIENHYIDRISSTNEIIKKLQEKDILVGIDDFGTGYSSISSIKHININYVKIDRLFMMNYPHNDDGEMFMAMVNLIHTINKPIIVEGIETQEQLDFAIKHKCRYAQGYYIARPESIQKVIKRLKSQGETI